MLQGAVRNCSSSTPYPTHEHDHKKQDPKGYRTRENRCASCSAPWGRGEKTASRHINNEPDSNNAERRNTKSKEFSPRRKHQPERGARERRQSIRRQHKELHHCSVQHQWHFNSIMQTQTGISPKTSPRGSRNSPARDKTPTTHQAGGGELQCCPTRPLHQTRWRSGFLDQKRHDIHNTD